MWLQIPVKFKLKSESPALFSVPRQQNFAGGCFSAVFKNNIFLYKRNAQRYFSVANRSMILIAASSLPLLPRFLSFRVVFYIGCFVAG